MKFEDTFSLDGIFGVVDKIISNNLIPINATVILSGGLGAGKTTFTRAFFQKFGVNDVTSPTYNLHNQYSGTSLNGQKIVLNHWDLYRCNVIPEELIEPIPSKAPSYTFVEWGDKFIDELKPAGFLLITLEVIDQNHRKIIISA